MTDDDFFSYAPEEEDAGPPPNFVEKGQSLDLTALDATLHEIMIGAGWDLKPFDAEPLDADVSCFLLNAQGKTRENADFVFYNAMEGCGGAVIHNGDSRTGAGEGDDETISLDLHAVPFDVARIVFVLTIHDGAEREQDLSGVKGGFLRLVDRRNSHEIARYVLDNALVGVTETGMLVAELERNGHNWTFRALGEPEAGGLAVLARRYGIVVAEDL